MLTAYQIQGLGWLPDYPDQRDYTDEHAAVRPLLASVGAARPVKSGLPANVDLRQWMLTESRSGRLGSCTAKPVSALSSTSSGARSAAT